MLLFCGALLEIVGWGCPIVLVNFPFHRMVVRVRPDYTGNSGPYSIYKEEFTGNTGTMWFSSLAISQLSSP